MQKRARNGSLLDGVVFHVLHRASQRADDLFVISLGAGAASSSKRVRDLLISLSQLGENHGDMPDAAAYDLNAEVAAARSQTKRIRQAKRRRDREPCTDA